MDQSQVKIVLSRQELLQLLNECNLLSADELDCTDAIDPSFDGQALADALLGSGVLTPFQMDAAVNGRHEKLRIGNYDVLDKLGAGGTGTVFKARHRKMKRVVALKVLARNLCKDKTFVQRFQREVENIAQLSHPNVVMAYDADEAKIGHFLVMEFVDGLDFATIVQRKGPLPLAEAGCCILQVARGLSYVHSRGMIHRDIKPANLLRDGLGVVKLTDLGLARFASSHGVPLAANSLTQAGGVLGTVDYMPPEQAMDSTNIDHRADIYGLGATLYFLLVGEPPYPGHTMMDTLLKHRDAPIPSLLTTRPDLPALLDDLLRRMLAKTPAERFNSMSEVVTALEGVQSTYGDTAIFAKSTLMPPADQAKGLPPARPRQTAPLPRAVPDRTMDLPPMSQEANASMSVLVVEPSRTQSSIIRLYLRSQSIERVVLASSGKEALRLARKAPPDVVVGAMYLPDMTGVQFSQKLRAEYGEDAPGFVLIASELDSEDSGALSKTGATTLLRKPFAPAQLVDALAAASGQLLMKFPTTPDQLGLTLVKPRNAAEPSPVNVRLERAEIPLNRLRVLIVDDSKPARMYIRGKLEEIGLKEFNEAADGAQAVGMLVRESFDLIITDYNMPLMDGRNLIAYLKQNPVTAAIPVIMVTTETDSAKLTSVRDLGVTAICEKTFSAETMRAMIDRL